MKRGEHLIEPEELMAYLDGGLEPERAVAVAAHLGECIECQMLASDLRFTSRQLAVWDVEPTSPAVAAGVLAELKKGLQKSPDEGRALQLFANFQAQAPQVAPWAWGLGAAVAGAFILFGTWAYQLWFPAPSRLVPVTQVLTMMEDKNPSVSELPSPYNAAPRSAGGGGGGGRGSRRALTPGMMAKLPRTLQSSSSTEGSAHPMIVRTTSLSLVVKNFGTVRSLIEQIMDRYHGFTSELTVSGQEGAGRTLTATFRVPANQIDGAIAELRTVGRLLQETQNAEDVTRQYVDLRARLSNARRTEERLLEIMRTRTGKLSDVLEAEQEIARVRGDIEQMVGEQKSLESSVQYAALKLTVCEEYKAQLDIPSSSVATRLRNSVVKGYQSLVESSVGLLMFLLSFGPALIFWALLLFFPARFVWNRLRRSVR